MKKIFALAIVMFAAIFFTNTSASAQVFVGGPRVHIGVALNGAYAQPYYASQDYAPVCDYDEYNRPFNCQPDYPEQSYYANGCGYSCDGYYYGGVGVYYGRDYRYDRRGGRGYDGYRNEQNGPRGGYPVQRGGYPVGQRGGGFQGNAGGRSGGVSRGGGGGAHR